MTGSVPGKDVLSERKLKKGVAMVPNPCPGCGSTRLIAVSVNQGCYIKCGVCERTGNMVEYQTEQDNLAEYLLLAIRKWNREEEKEYENS